MEFDLESEATEFSNEVCPVGSRSKDGNVVQCTRGPTSIRIDRGSGDIYIGRKGAESEFVDVDRVVYDRNVWGDNYPRGGWNLYRNGDKVGSIAID